MNNEEIKMVAVECGRSLQGGLLFLQQESYMVQNSLHCSHKVSKPLCSFALKRSIEVLIITVARKLDFMKRKPPPPYWKDE